MNPFWSEPAIYLALIFWVLSGAAILWMLLHKPKPPVRIDDEVASEWQTKRDEAQSRKLHHLMKGQKP